MNLAAKSHDVAESEKELASNRIILLDMITKMWLAVNCLNQILKMAGQAAKF